MFLKLLEKLAAEYRDGESYMGGDVDEDLQNLGLRQALYDLGVLRALPAPADGEVVVDTTLARDITAVVKMRRVSLHLACSACWVDVGPDAVRRKRLKGRILDRGAREPVEIWDIRMFCLDCARTAGAEWLPYEEEH